MLYLYLEKNAVKLLQLKKTLLNQFDSRWYEKKFQSQLIRNTAPASVDVLASAIREAVASLPDGGKEREVTLILPQSCFSMVRSEAPAEMAISAISSFMQEEAQKAGLNLEQYSSDFVAYGTEKDTQVVLYAIDKVSLQTYVEVLHLLGLKLVGLMPDALAIYTLFEKTLRRDKLEYILFAHYDKSSLRGYLFDSYGPIKKNSRIEESLSEQGIEEFLQEYGRAAEEKKMKINRLILSGPLSELVRQDTFTKQVGIWTNPLKRIMPQFYGEYLKLVSPAQSPTPFPYLSFDVCFGAFMFMVEHKSFNLLRGNKTRRSSSGGAGFGAIFGFIKKLIPFVLAFSIVFGLILLVAKLDLFAGAGKFTFFAAPSPTPSPAPTAAPSPSPSPSPAIDKAAMRVRVLNGSGVKGKATEVKDLLNSKGYEQILTGNADSFNYEVTEVKFKASVSSSSAAFLSDIEASTSDPKVSNDLSEKDAADVQLTFGKDFK